MDIEKAYKTLEEVARRKFTTVEVVIAEIDAAIAEAISTATNTRNINVLNAWKKIPCVGEVPTAVELVACLGEIVAIGIDINNDSADCTFMN